MSSVAAEEGEHIIVQNLNKIRDLTKDKDDEDSLDNEELTKVLSIDIKYSTISPTVTRTAWANLTVKKLFQVLRLVAEECRKGLAEKMLATKSDGYQILIRACQIQDLPVKTEAMRALTDFLDGNPDSLDTEGFRIMLLGEEDLIFFTFC